MTFSNPAGTARLYI